MNTQTLDYESMDSQLNNSKSKVNNRIAGVWGFLEATIFFIVPDVLLTYLGSRKDRPLLMPILMATLGAFIGGLLMYCFGHSNYGLSSELITRIPAIDSAMTEQVRILLNEHGLWALFIGPLQGIPFKIFAIEATLTSINPALFLLISIPARMMRFVLLAYLARLLVTTVFKSVKQRTLTLIWLCGWVGFYGFYFYHFGF
ncbi:MAG: hypothetical protein HWE27_14300 [Gammaproteobacteria bacterium]|nr:hypothetical protein [Gammaproteobacteria bacterium]